MKRSASRPHRFRPVPTVCFFCDEKQEPSYKDLAVLERYTTDRGKIIARAKSGTCRKHQRLLKLSIKHARHVALLPFVPGVF